MRHLCFWQKTYLLTLLLFLVSLFGGMGLLGWQNQQASLQREMEKAQSEQHFIAQNLGKDLSAIQNSIHLRIPSLARSYGQYYLQDGILLEVRRGDEVLFSTLPAAFGGWPHTQKEQQGQVWAVQTASGIPYSLVTSPLPGENSGYILTCARSLQPLTDALGQMRRSFTLGCMGISLVLAIGLFITLRSLSKPLERLAGIADAFAGGDFGARATRKGTDEIGNLAHSLNAMADTAEQNIAEIQNTAEQKARMAANLSHEIRTPLTAIQGYAEYLLLAETSEAERVSALQHIQAESLRMQKISERMLQLAALEHNTIAKTPLELAELVDCALISITPAAKAAGVLLQKSPLPQAVVMGDKVLLESLLINLLENAIKASKPGKTVTLAAQAGQDAVSVSIADTGRGMQKEELERLGEPFYRPDASRSRKEGGAGLGVALCYQIAGLHGASLRYASAPGKGTTATLTFTSL